MKSHLIKNSRKIGIARSITLLVVIEVLIFLFGYAAFFAIGAFSGGISEGFGLESGIFYSWFAFVLLGLLGWAVCMTALIVCQQKQ